MIRRAWPEIMDTLAGIKRATWMVVVNEATPRAFDGATLELVFKSPGNAIGFNRANHLDNLSQAINQVLGLQIQINPLHDASAAAGESDPKAPSRQPSATSAADSSSEWGGSAAAGERPAESDDRPVDPPEPTERSEIWAPAPPAEANRAQAASDSWGLEEPPQDSPEPYEFQEPPVPAESPEPQTVEQPAPEPDTDKPLSRYQRMLNEAAVARHAADSTAGRRPGHVDLAYVEDVPSADDETVEESGLVGRAAIERILNGRLVEDRSLDAV